MKTITDMSLVDKIREKYPNPRSSLNNTRKKGYCVGGAYCLAHGVKLRYPTYEELADTLRRIGGVKKKVAIRYSCILIYENDRGQFEKAWTALETVLATVKRPRSQ